LVEQIDSALRQAPSSPGRIRIASAGDLLQLDIERELALTAFDGPRPGLAVAGAATVDSVPADGGFLPRALVPMESIAGATGAEQLPGRGITSRESPYGPDLLSERVDVVPAMPVMTPDADEPAVLEVRVPGLAGFAAAVPADGPTIAIDLVMARTAWAYVERNLHQRSGLVSAVAGYPHATMWDVGSTFAAAVSAEQLGVIDHARLLAVAGGLLDRLSAMPLYNNELPNREYEIGAAIMLDARGQQSTVGSGWSALDLGRLLTWLHITRSWYPELAPRVNAVVARWKFDRLVKAGELNGVMREEGLESLRQEGRLGYEQYAAVAYRLWGHTAAKALGYSHRAYEAIEGVRVPHDTRTHSFLTSEPFMLAAMELGGISTEFQTMTRAIYDVQRQRAVTTGTLVAVSEDSLSREPWFVYNTIWNLGTAWVGLSPSGRSHPAQRSLSTKAAFAWDAIYGDDYSARLLDAVRGLMTPAGFAAGRFDDGTTNSVLNINTNAVILEALLYKARHGRPFISIDSLEAGR